jgi:Polyketide cyclase / dehydrase and lipid transport
MRTYTTSIHIQSPPSKALDFLADGSKLPVWAIGFAKAVEHDGMTWVVTLASGDRMPMRIDADPATGVVDFVALPRPGIEAPTHSRVLPSGGGTLYTFSMHQTPDLPDEVFDAQAAELDRELTVLKAHLETACPL